MTGKELQKLKRQELLQLLLEQSKEVAQLQERHGEADQQARELEESNRRLGAKLTEKGAQGSRLQGRIDTKEGRIQQLEGEISAWRRAREEGLSGAGSVAGAALRLNGMLDVARQAAEQYLYNVRQRCLTRGHGPGGMGGSGE